MVLVANLSMVEHSQMKTCSGPWTPQHFFAWRTKDLTQMVRNSLLLSGSALISMVSWLTLEQVCHILMPSRQTCRVWQNYQRL